MDLPATRPARTVLALNSGSSSLKFGLYRTDGTSAEALFCGEAESIGTPSSPFRLRDAEGRMLLSETSVLADHQEACARIDRLFDEGRVPAPEAVGHRVVHGGVHLRHHCLIDAAVMERLDEAVAFAPLHVPTALAIIRFAQERFPKVPQVACLDTAFHVDLPAMAGTLPIARWLRDEGIQRFGFHGLSCESILHQLGESVPPRLVIAHLGNGASITAVRAGRSIDTSMGLTPSGGVMMATRCGDLDPGVLTYLVRERKFDAAALEDLVDHRSGMLGVSALSGDMRRLRAAAATDAHARLAIDMFGYSVRKHIAAMIAALGGIELLVFTGGIGEHDAATRTEICNGLGWFGIESVLPRDRRSPADPFRPPVPRVGVSVLPSQEESQIARHTWHLAP
jgi:acetate kinase